MSDCCLWLYSADQWVLCPQFFVSATPASTFSELVSFSLNPELLATAAHFLLLSGVARPCCPEGSSLQSWAVQWEVVSPSWPPLSLRLLPFSRSLVTAWGSERSDEQLWESHLEEFSTDVPVVSLSLYLHLWGGLTSSALPSLSNSSVSAFVLKLLMEMETKLFPKGFLLIKVLLRYNSHNI